MIRLTNVMNFLDCPQASVNKVNLELFGDKYVKAVTEAMMPSGYITEEYLDGLERLRNRLGLSQEDTQNLMGVSARSRLIPVVKDLVDMWKSDTDSTKRREKEVKEAKNKKDKSGDPISSLDNVFGYMETGAQKEGGGPNVFMRESLNLVDFFIENYLTEGVDINTIEDLPVTAVGIVPESEIAGMFKHYLITRISEQDDELRARYVENERIFALILGIAPEGQDKVKESLAYSAYKSMLKNILRFKDAVETQDIKQFALLKDTLKLDGAIADKVLDEASRAAVIEHAASFMRPKDGDVTAEMARRFRNQVNLDVI
jgi:CRISPR/Cas system CMR subunit Cmr6 (Cas7 group RAMP superfamily)